MIKAVAIDDEPLALDIIESFCAQTDSIKLENKFTKVDQAIEYLKKNKVDLLFLDIHMPKMSGIEFVKIIDYNPMVIFSTAHSQYAVEGFNLNAIDYLLKPYSFERFEAAIAKAIDFFTFAQKPEATATKIFFRTNYSLVAVEISDITLIESFGDNLTVHYGNNQSLNTRMTMKSIMEKLPQGEFVRVHRSYIVPTKSIKEVQKKYIVINGMQIPIGVRYEDEFKKTYK